MSLITIQQKGILDIPVDAIVNAANSGLLAGAVYAGCDFLGGDSASPPQKKAVPSQDTASLIHSSCN